MSDSTQPGDLIIRAGYLEEFCGTIELIDDNPRNPIYRIMLPPRSLSMDHPDVSQQPNGDGCECDLVGWLRAYAKLKPGIERQHISKAADEIERLRSELARTDGALKSAWRRIEIDENVLTQSQILDAQAGNA